MLIPVRPIVAFMVAAVTTASGWAWSADRPNILFIFADDQCYETVGAFGMNEVQTPNLDRLAQRGLTLTHAYNMGSWSGAVCIASRTMLNTGRYLWHAHRIYDQSESEREAGRFWSEQLKAARYDTYMTGKWHVRADVTKAFDVATHVRGGMPNQTPQGYHRPIPGQPDPWSPWDPKFGGFWKGGKHWSEVVADDAIRFLHQARQSENPFFMYIAFNAAHDPRQSPREYVERYPTEKVRLPANFMTEYPFKDQIGCGPQLRDEQLAPFPRTAEAVKVHRREYYAIITHMDAQIGRILEALEQSGMGDNTFIFFTADHGLAVGQHGLFGKQNMYDHSVRVPCIINGPGVAANRRVATPVYLQDIMPTTLELAGVERPAYVEFNSLMPLLRGKDYKPYDAIYGAYLKLQRMITMDGYKLILYPQAKKARLYNLSDDPKEMKDLVDDPSQQNRIRRLFRRFVALQQETGDELDVTAVFSQYN